MGRLVPGILAGVSHLLCSSGLNWTGGKVNFTGTLSCHPRPGLGMPSLADSQERVLCPFSHPLQRCCSHGSQRALPSVLRGREPDLVELVTSSGWSPSYVHTSRGITPSLLPSGGNKDSSSRNLRGKWTRWPLTWVSSDRAKGGLTMARGSTATYSRSVRSERVALDGRQRKIWERGGTEKPIRLGKTLSRAQAQLSWKPTSPYQP